MLHVALFCEDSGDAHGYQAGLDHFQLMAVLLPQIIPCIHQLCSCKASDMGGKADNQLGACICEGHQSHQIDQDVY